MRGWRVGLALKCCCAGRVAGAVGPVVWLGAGVVEARDGAAGACAVPVSPVSARVFCRVVRVAGRGVLMGRWVHDAAGVWLRRGGGAVWGCCLEPVAGECWVLCRGSTGVHGACCLCGWGLCRWAGVAGDGRCHFGRVGPSARWFAPMEGVWGGAAQPLKGLYPGGMRAAGGGMFRRPRMHGARCRAQGRGEGRVECWVVPGSVALGLQRDGPAVLACDDHCG